MNVPIPDCPSWLQELTRYLYLKNLLFLHGNILDHFAFPLRNGDNGTVYWTESTRLTELLHRFLTGAGYEVTGFYDPVDGLSFPDETMRKCYARLRSGKQVDDRVPLGKDSAARPAATPPEQKTISDAMKQESGPQKIISTLEGITKSLENASIPCAFVFNLASRLISSPDQLQSDERDIFTRLLKASLTARVDIMQGGTLLNNIIILICDKLSDLPAFTYLNNPRARSIFIPKPDTKERTRFITRQYRAFHQENNANPREPTPEFKAQFAALTEGMTYYELKSLVSLSCRETIPVSTIRGLCERYKFGVTESEWNKIDRVLLDSAEAKIRSRIKGQDTAVAAVLDIIKRAKIGLAAGTSRKSNRPRGILFFAGPTGVGKTELAKALADLLFQQEERLIRFDMSEYSAPHADQKLLGAPPGYVGYEEGGQLTNAVRENPFSILLFDEIEKAHGSIFDKFLQILDDGRLTDGRGNTVYFSECIIIFTSNLGTAAGTNTLAMKQETKPTSQMPPMENMQYAQLKNQILQAIRDHFNLQLGRPEILNRFGENFVVFDFIRPPLDEEILDLQLTQLIEAAKEHHLNLKIDGPVRQKLVELARQNLHQGGRGIRNILDAALVNPLNRILFDQGIDYGCVHLLDLHDYGPDTPIRFVLNISANKADEDSCAGVVLE